MSFGAIGPIAVHYPARVETNEDLQRECPDWDMSAIAEKTGVLRRHIAAANECSSDLGVAAAQKLFREYSIDPASIDYLLLCTQTPDYPLPTTACLLQQRLGLRQNIGAIDFNQGCSGFVYGVSLADGLIRTGAVRRVLLITAETYSKFIDAGDRSLRTIFGDAAAATLIDSHEEESISAYEFGTDGSGANTLMVTAGGHRPAADAHKPRGRKRWASDLYMDGQSLISFTVAEIPGVIERILAKARKDKSDIDLFLMHQATRKLLEQLQFVLELDNQRLPINLQQMGNTVSSTIPILINQLRSSGKLTRDQLAMMIGFGVGWSWAGCVWRDIAHP